jgi:hypothetical protein
MLRMLSTLCGLRDAYTCKHSWKQEVTEGGTLSQPRSPKVCLIHQEQLTEELLRYPHLQVVMGDQSDEFPSEADRTQIDKVAAQVGKLGDDLSLVGKIPAVVRVEPAATGNFSLYLHTWSLEAAHDVQSPRVLSYPGPD